GGLLAELGADRCLTFAGAVAFVKEQVKHLMYGVEASDKLASRWWHKLDLLLDQVAGGALDALFDRLFAHKQGAGDFRMSEAAQGLEGKRELVFTGQPGMATGEDHPELTVLDLRVDEQLVKVRLLCRARVGPVVEDALADPVVADGVEDFVFCDAVDPPGRV